MDITKNNSKMENIVNGVRYISLLDGIDTDLSSHYNNDITPFKAIINDMYAKSVFKIY